MMPKYETEKGENIVVHLHPSILCGYKQIICDYV